MRIAYILTSLGMGGAEKQTVALAQRMTARGHAVVMLILRERQKEEWPTPLEVHYLNTHRSALSLLRGLLRARRILRNFRPDLLHSHTFPANMMARTLRLFGAAPAVLSTIHNVYEGGPLRTWAYRLTDGLSMHTTAVSRAAAERYIHIKAVAQYKCTVVTNAIDVAEFTPDPACRIVTRNTLGGAEDFIWLAAGRIVPAKDFPNLLHAFAKTWPVYPRTQLWLVGEGGGSGRTEYLAGSTDHGTLARIRILGLRRDMPALLDAADAFVLSSAWEGMPLVVGEAMAMEKPVVATNVGGVQELIGDAGVMVPAKDPAALAEAMLAVMRLSPQQRQAQGNAARQRIAAHFSFATRTDEWEAFYRSLLEGRSANTL